MPERLRLATVRFLLLSGGTGLLAFGIAFALVALDLHRALTWRCFEEGLAAFPKDEVWDTRADLERYDGVTIAWPKAERPPARGERPSGLRSPAVASLLGPAGAGTAAVALADLWERNEPLRDRLVRAAAEPWGTARRMPKTEARFHRPVNIRHAQRVAWAPVAVLLGAHALAEGDVRFALAASSALLRHARAVGLTDGGAPDFVAGLARDGVVECADELFRRAAIEPPALGSVETGLVRDAIARRLIYLRDRVTPGEMFAAELRNREWMYSALRDRSPFVFRPLEWIFGSPLDDDPFRLVADPDAAGCAAAVAETRAARERYLGTARKGGSSRWHPLRRFASVHRMRLDALLADAATVDARFRLATVAALARLHRREHDAWPDPTADVAFTAACGLAMKDPMDGGTLRFAACASGTLRVYSVGVDGRDDGGDPGKDIVVEVAPLAAEP